MRSLLTNSKQKNDRECSNIKSSRVSALTGSAPCKMAKGLQWVSKPLSQKYESITVRKQYMNSHTDSYLANLNWFFAFRIVVLRLLMLNIKARSNLPEFLTANLSSIIYFFTLHKFCSMLIKQLINLRKVRTENLKFRTDLRDLAMDGWLVTQ